MILWSESGSPLFILKRNNIGFGEIGHKLRRERGRKEGRKGALETADITWTDAADITLARAREWAADGGIGRGTAGKKSLQ